MILQRVEGCGSGHTPRKDTPRKVLPVYELSVVDSKVPKTHTFKPSQVVGPHLPASAEAFSPADLFKLFFNAEIVQKICDASNEYTERNKDRLPGMYRYYTTLTPEDFYVVFGVFAHLGYRKIPRYQLMWKPTSLCYDRLISKVFSRNKFGGYISFLHVVDEATEKRLITEGNKLAKVHPLYEHLQERCKDLYQPNREISNR